MKIAIVSFVNLDKINSGQKKRIFDLINGLSYNFSVDYIEITHQRAINKKKISQNKNFNHFELHYNYNWHIKLIINFINIFLFNIFGIKKSVQLGFYGAFINKSKIKEWNYDIVISEYFMTSFIFKYLNNKSLKVIDMHDIQYITLQSQLINRIDILKKIQLYFAKKVEINLLKKSDVLIAVNLNEIEILKKLINTNFIFTPLTISSNIKTEKLVKLNKENIKIGFFAGLSSKRSFIEIKFLVENIIEKLISKYNYSIEFYLYGSNPSVELINYSKKKQFIKLIGEVSNIQESFKLINFGLYYWEGESYGFRTRILDILSTSTPILLNKSCIEGMGINDTTSLLFYENVNDVNIFLKLFIENEIKYTDAVNNCYDLLTDFQSYKVYENLTKSLQIIYKNK